MTLIVSIVLGLPDLTVALSKLGGPSAINDALLSGSVHFSLQGVPSLALLWDRTKGGIGGGWYWRLPGGREGSTTPEGSEDSPL